MSEHYEEEPYLTPSTEYRQRPHYQSDYPISKTSAAENLRTNFPMRNEASGGRYQNYQNQDRYQSQTQYQSQTDARPPPPSPQCRPPKANSQYLAVPRNPIAENTISQYGEYQNQDRYQVYRAPSAPASPPARTSMPYHQHPDPHGNPESESGNSRRSLRPLDSISRVGRSESLRVEDERELQLGFFGEFRTPTELRKTKGKKKSGGQFLFVRKPGKSSTRGTVFIQM